MVVRKIAGAVVIVILMMALHVMIPHYEILSQHSFSSPEHRETIISAVCHSFGPKLYQAGDEIITEHRRLNGDMPVDRITIIFYRNKRDVEKGKRGAVLIYEWKTRIDWGS